MAFRNDNILKKFPFGKNKTKLILIGIIILVVLSTTGGIFLLSQNSTAKTIFGLVYVDGKIAPAGVNVKIIFPYGEVTDFDGTDDQGCYSIDISDHVIESGSFLIIYNGNTFIPHDEYGNFINVTTSDGVFLYSIDLFIFTTEDNSSENDDPSNNEGDSGDSNDDSSSDETNDGSDDAGDSDGSDDSDKSDDDSSDDDSNDDSSDDSDDGTDNNDSSDDSNDSSDDDSNDSDDDSPDPHTSCIKVEMLIWDYGLVALVEDVAVNIGEIVRFNISIKYNGSFMVSDVDVLDMMPEGLEYAGNATVDGVNDEPTINETNHSLLWNIPSISSSQTVFIEFDANVTDKATYANYVHVTAKESIGQTFNKTSHALVIGGGAESIFCRKKVKIANSSWVDQIDAHVGDVASFNISISNVGNTTLYNLNIFDKLPQSLTYVENSSRISFNNNTFQEEPYKDVENNTLFWVNINQITQDYLPPLENLSLVFNVTVDMEGLTVNTVKISSTVCNECTPLTGSDTASINATKPIPKLAVNAGGPYYGSPRYTMTFTAIATGGISPYTYKWDLNNDGQFDDGNGSAVSKQWTEEGNYTISVQVIDNESTNATDITFVNISIQPLMIDAGGPYEEFAGEAVTFSGTATGGVTNYAWHWEFGDGNMSTLQHPVHIYMDADTYVALLTVTDDGNHTKNDTTQVIIRERDTVPPTVKLTKPSNALYIKNRAIFPFFKPIIFGDIEICLSASDNESAVELIELYINDDLVNTSYSSSGNWTWDEQVFGRRIIKIIAYDVAGNNNTMEKVVWKFF